MRRFAPLAFIALAFACAKSDTPATDTAAAPGAVAAPAAPAGLELSQVAGTWNVRTMGEDSDSTLNTYVLTATNTRDGWSMKFPNREPVQLRIVDVAGDSIITEAGPFESVLRPGLQVTTRSVQRLQDGKLIGRTRAKYAGPRVGADTIRNLRQEGVRAQ